MLANNNITTQNSYARFYNASGIGYVQADMQNWHSTSTVRYYSSNTERELIGDKTIDLTYIQSHSGLVAAIKTTGAQHDVMLLASDHLGSIIGVWNANGTLLEEYRYLAC